MCFIIYNMVIYSLLQCAVSYNYKCADSYHFRNLQCICTNIGYITESGTTELFFFLLGGLAFSSSDDGCCCFWERSTGDSFFPSMKHHHTRARRVDFCKLGYHIFKFFLNLFFGFAATVDLLENDNPVVNKGTNWAIHGRSDMNMGLSFFIQLKVDFTVNQQKLINVF